ncbi:aminoacyl-histidine dipeptidase [Youngiibacter fragilis]|uniref:Cytosol non-specific dipeptidase n=1 Tax=Youngiibacter fragilis 232.1 TaxID=994573 RepID=V7I6N5_9CLOT|nr:aminoacyl-histidine dipeptidase [Youngiibacter fragilis]ETA80956.1 aminoacyl-histidine dipeptidase [Youngiibacter fragilis 232.1]
MGVLTGLKPEKVMRFFEEISMIPRGSGNEKGISDYLKDFAIERGLQVVQDDVLNIIIRKSGTKGYENSPAVILQGHMDMVNEKNKDTVHDFMTDPLRLRLLDDYIYASGTTLGADNGIAVAYSLAILDSDDIPHPPIEVLVTVEEETGLLGAAKVDGSHFKGKTLINLDSEEEGVFLVSCAGGARQIISLPVVREAAVGSAFRIQVKGLKGGHSGMEIHKERGNSNKILGRILHHLSKKYDIRIAEISGGSKMNAIPRESEALVVVRGDAEGFNDEVLAVAGVSASEIRTQDPGLTVAAEAVPLPAETFDKETTRKAEELLLVLPDGVLNFSQDIPGLVETSLNLGVLQTMEDSVKYEFAVRSSVETRKKLTLEKVRTLSASYGADSEISSSYPGWNYDKDSKIRQRFLDTYRRLYGRDAEVTAIHAGVECGLLSEKIDGLDMISLGPDMYDVHTPEEHISISSIARTYDLLLEVLRELK